MAYHSPEEIKRLNGNGKVAIHLCLKDGHVVCFISLGNWHLNPCGTEGIDWCYGELVDSDLDLKLGLVAMSQSVLPRAGIDFTIVALCEVRPAAPEQRNISIFRLWKD